MQDKFLINHAEIGEGKVLPWFSTQLDWPFEVVEAEIEVVAPREATELEWVLLRILRDFEDAPPTLAEASMELGIQVSVFLDETLRELVSLTAVEIINQEQAVSLANSRLTSIGRELLADDHAPSLPEHHGMHLYFDTITGEHLPVKPRHVRKMPAHPVLDGKKLPQRIQHLGLDRVRQLCQRQAEPFQQAESQISAVTVHEEKGYHLWMPVQVSVSITAPGVLQACLDGGTEAQQAWFDKYGWNLEYFNRLASASTSWGHGRCALRMPPVPAATWVQTVERCISPASTADEARRLIDTAAQEAILHGGWCDIPELEKDLARAAQRGVRCYVCGGESSLNHWSNGERGSPGFVVTAGRADTVRPLAIIVDRSRGLRVDRVCARTPADREMPIEVAAFVRPAELPAIQEGLLVDVLEDLDEEDNQHLLAKFALTGHQNLWQKGVRSIEDKVTGIERVEQLRQWAQWAQNINGKDESHDEYFLPATQSWWAMLEADLAGLDGDRIQFIDAAVGLIPPADILTALARRNPPASANTNLTPLCELIELAGHICKRWSDFNPLRDCPPFAQAMRSHLPADSGGYHQVVHQALQIFSENPRFDAEGRLWLQILSAGIPPGHDLLGFLDWLEAHEPLKGYLGSSFQTAARQQLDRLEQHIRKAGAQKDGLLGRLQEAWNEAGLPAHEFARLSRPPWPNRYPKRYTANVRRAN